MYDHIVIGVGGMGSATVYELAKRGRKVLGLEQFDIPHAMGSSHGLTRIFRHAYNEHPDYVPMMRHSFARWQALERDFGEQLIHVSGGLDVGPKDGAVVSGALESCKLHNLEHEVLSAADLMTRHPAYRVPDDFAAVAQPEAGFLLSERCIVAHVSEALKLGAEVRGREPVEHWEADGEGVAVRTTRGTYRAGSLVITAGAWAGKLVDGLAPHAVPERQALGWFQPRSPELFEAARFPVFILEGEGGIYYGFPLYGIPGVKFGLFYHLEEVVDPDTMNREANDADEAVLRAGLSRYFPDADGPVMSFRTCMFTNTVDKHFVLDLLPGLPQVSVAAGFSGHGFKFCSSVGEIMADLAMERASRTDIAMFALDRLAADA